MAPSTPIEVVRSLLGNPTDHSHVSSLVAPNATYQSLSYADSNPALTKVLPYAGVHPSAGPAQIVHTFQTVAKIWFAESFEVKTMFSEGPNVAVFGAFVYTSRTLGKSIKSPFSIHAVVEDVEGGLMITYMQFMEDTMGTTGVFKKESRYGVYVVDPVTKTEVDV